MLNSTQTLYQPHNISVSDYQKMAETGILDESVRVELVEGEIVDMAPIGSRHAAVVNRLMRLLVNATDKDAIVSVQNPVVLGDYSEPVPDLVLLKPKSNDYEDALPQAQDILLAIEVADSSLRYDLQIKAPLYAQFKIPELWLIDLQQQSITMFQKPVENQYSLEITLRSPETISPLLLSKIKINLQQIF